MLRQVALQKAPLLGASSTTIRWLAAAATSKQKRSLNPQQLKGHKGAVSDADKPTPPSSTAPPVAPPLAVDASSGGGGIMLPIAIAGSVAAGGAYYYFNVAPPQAHPTQIGSVLPPIGEKKTEKASSTGNRVLSIQVPSKMKNASTATVVAPSHPPNGNRVGLITAAYNKAAATKVEDTSMTVSAIQELTNSVTEKATESLVESHQSLWSSVDAYFFRDLDSLNTSQLKARVVQLATEMKDRTKWEAVRLKEFLAMKERETADQYMQVMQKQRLEFEDLLAKRMREQENSLVQQTQRALQEKDAAIQNVLNTALEAQTHEHEEDKKAFEQATGSEIQSKLEEAYTKQMEELKSQSAGELEKKVTILEALSQKIDELEKELVANQTTQQGSFRAHRLSAAALALAEKLETNQSAANELQALKVAAGTGGVITTAVATIPQEVKSGIPTLSELQLRFEVVHKKCRQAALVPAGRPGLEGQLAGMVFATLKYPPNPEDPAPENDKDNAEYLLVRARKHVQLGELERAVEQLEKLEGQTAFTITDWKKDALNRVAVDKALKVIKMECALVNESLTE